MTRKVKRKIKSIRGVLIDRLPDGIEVLRIRYWYKGKEHRETIGPLPEDKTERRNALADARDKLDSRRQEIRQCKLRGEEWLAPADRKRLEQQQLDHQQRQVDLEREPLRITVACEQFCDECADEYARPREVRARLDNLVRFADHYHLTHLDQLTRPIIRQYYLDRRQASGPFTESKPVSIRAPQVEVSHLSAVYTWRQDQGHDLENPCHRPRTRRKDSPLGAYRRERDPIIAKGREQRQAIFDAAPDDTMKALFMACYYGAGRPESEPCQLRHGDVSLPEPGKVRTLTGLPAMGTMIFRSTKTGADRTLPIHPELAEGLRSIMDPRPDDQAEVEGWAAKPIFRKRSHGGKRNQHDTTEPMDRHSYRVAWANTRQAAIQAPDEGGNPRHPELAGMWLRDLRATARTVMTNAEVPEVLTRYVLGHEVGVSGGYYVPTETEFCRAILTLGEGKPYTKPYTNPTELIEKAEAAKAS